MTSREQDQAVIEAHATIAFKALTDLDRVIEARCPGPHQPVQHRDERAPWCHACRRTVEGQEVP